MSKLGNKSICGKCEWHEYSQTADVHCCPAFPPCPPYGGIPEKYTSGKEKHLQIEEGQAVDVFFKEKAIMPIL